MAENKGFAESLAEAEAPPAYSATDSRVSPELPSYQDVQQSTYTGAPPSYESLFGKIKATKQSSRGFFDFLKSLLGLFIGTVGFTIFLAFMLAIPIAMIVIGAKYLGDCPAERYIPIYLIVAGCFSTTRNLVAIGRRCKAQNEEQEAEENNKKVNPLETIVDCFMIAWFIAGNVWIYRTKNRFTNDPEDDNFCDPVLYWFAFWVTTAIYILVACCCGLGCFIVTIASILPM